MISILVVAAVAVAVAVLARPGAGRRTAGDLAGRIAAHRRAWDAFDTALRPWEQAGRAPRTDRGAPSLS